MRSVLFRFIIFFCIILVNSNSIRAMEDNCYIPAEYVVIAQKIRSDMAKKLSKRYQMAVIGDIGGLAGGVNVLGLCFEIQGPLEKDRLREILVDCVEEFLCTINANERIRPRLKNYPFTENEIEIQLFIRDKNWERLFDPYIGVAVAENREIVYLTFDPIETYKHKSETIENYQDTLKIVRESQGR